LRNFIAKLIRITMQYASTCRLLQPIILLVRYPQTTLAPTHKVSAAHAPQPAAPTMTEANQEPHHEPV
jgi:hypothetical protein